MSGFLLRLARQWVAGETLEEGIERTRKANSHNILGLLNLLGEHVESRERIATNVREYSKLLERIDQSRVNSQISIKPTQLGLAVDYDYCLQNYLEVAERCKTYSNLLWIDMESSLFTQKTIDIYKRVLVRYPNTGIAVQACLRRSEDDLKDLLPLGAKIRLVKGAYNESSKIALKNRREISDNYAKLMKMLFEHPNKNFFAIATHDGRLIDIAKDLSAQVNTGFEFEMLMGVRDNLKTQLVKEGNQVREYIPYGPDWFAYSMRRLREKKSNILLLARSLFSS